MIFGSETNKNKNIQNYASTCLLEWSVHLNITRNYCPPLIKGSLESQYHKKTSFPKRNEIGIIKILPTLKNHNLKNRKEFISLCH